MPRLSRKETDENAARLVTNRFVAAADARTSREKAWNDARKRFDPQYVDKSRVKRGPPLKGAYVFRNVQTKVGNLLSMSEANGRWVVARSTTPDHGAIGETVTMALERQFRRSSADLFWNNGFVMERFARTGILYGNAYVYCSWVEHDEDWGVRLVHLDPFDVFPDWRDNRWIIVRRWITLAELYDLAHELSAPSGEIVGEDPETGEPIMDSEPVDGGRALKAAKMIEKELRSGKRSSNIDREFYAENANQRQHTIGRVADVDEGSDPYESPADDPFNARLMLLEYFETRRDGAHIRVVPGFGMTERNDLVIQKEKSPYGICPVVPFIPNPVDNEVWGYGESEIVGSLAEAMDTNLRAFQRIIGKSADTPLLVRRGLRLRQETLRSPSGRSIEVDNINEDMGYMPISFDPSLHHLASQVAKQWADNATGESEARRGQATGADSATEAAIAEQGGQTNDRLIYRNWRRSVEQIARVMLSTMKHRLHWDTAIPILGRDAEAFLRLRPEHLRGDFEVVFGGSTRGVNPRQEVAELLNVWGQFSATGTMDPNETLRTILVKIGVSNPDALMVQKRLKPMMSPVAENAAVFDLGMEIAVHPQDDHFDHAQKHYEALQRVAAENPFDANIPVMERHIQFHLVAQQQASGTASSAGGTPSNTTGPGEAMVATDSLANMQAERQRPNIDAGGASPGGIAPNRQVGQMVGSGGPR